MKRFLLSFGFLLTLLIPGISQNIGFNDDNSDPNTSAMVDVNSADKGLLIPRVSLDSTLLSTPITNPATSLLVYNTATIHDVIPGYYYWTGASWARLEASTDIEINFSIVTKSEDATLLKTETMVIADGDIVLMLPAISRDDDGLEIVIKNVGTYTDLVVVKPQPGQKIDANDSTKLTRWNGKTFLAYGNNWVVKNKDARADNVLDVSESGSFTTIQEAVEFLNNHMGAPTVIRLGGGTYEISSTITIDLPYPLTIQGISFGETIIDCPSGSTAINAISESYFKMLTFYGGTIPGIGINLSGPDTYYEIKDGYFYGLSKAITVTNSADFWLFEVDFESCTVAGIEIDAGSTNSTVFRSSECDYYDCAKGINLKSAGPESEVSIISGTFYNYDAGQVGVSYVPTTGSDNFRYTTMIIQNNAFNNVGEMWSGFDFSRADGRDADIFIENNAGIESTVPHCKFSVANNTAATTVTSAYTWYKVNNFNTFNYFTTKWTVDNNRITYQSTNQRDGVAFISGNIRCNNSPRILNIAVVRNGQSGTRYGETTVRIPNSNSNQSFQFSTNVYIEDINKDDYFEIWVTSSSSADQLTIDDLNWFTETH